MVELYAAFTVLSMDNGTRDAIIITLTGILANFFWHIVKYSWRACFGYSGGESYVTELKLKHDEQRDVSLKLRKERDGARMEREKALMERDEARKDRDEACKDRNKYLDERNNYWRERDNINMDLLFAYWERILARRQRDQGNKERDDARKQRDRAYEERDKLRKAKLESDENDKLSLLVLERHQCL